MRIIGGAAGGLLLKVPKGFDVRPTPDLVKQALFNSLGDRVAGARVLELFAGTGALGFESLSRGASHLVCVEKANRHARIIKENLATTRLPEEKFELRIQDAFTAMGQLANAGRQFDLVFADPPYGEKNIGRRSTSFAQQLLDDPKLPRLLAGDGVFVLGHTKRDTLSLPVMWEEIKMLKHGDSVMRFLKRAGDPLPEATREGN
jgi:16S rRNA (guanine(966)-N(2))-methyltransferase RsmD